MEENHEYTVLMEGIQYALDQVRGFNFYSRLVNQIQEKPDEIPDIFRNVTGSCLIPMVIYRLGRIQYSYAARFQLALALLLREVPGLEIRQEIIVCCDDLTLNQVEERALKAHGCKIIRMSGGRFRWIVDELTLFFLPSTRPEVVGDLLQMNWCSSQLEKMIILGESLTSMACDLNEIISTRDNEERPPNITIKKLTYVTDRLRYMWAIRKHTWEFEINDESSSIDESQDYNPEQIFQNMCWHGFDFDGIDIIEKDMNNFLPTTDFCFKWVDDEISYPYRMDEDDFEELPRLQFEMEITIMELRQSEHYYKFRDQLYNNPLLKNEISCRLASVDQVQMVIYGLGTLEYYFDSHYQLALALLLKEEIDMLRIGEIQVFDPVITPVDAALLRSFGCTVLSVNEYARRRVEKPILFFLPFAPYDLVANILETNWSASNLNNIIILGVSMHEFDEQCDQPDYGIFTQTEIGLMEKDRCRYMSTIKNWSVDFTVDKEDIQRPLNPFSWVFFNLPPDFDMNSILPSFPTLSKIQVDHENAVPDDDDVSELRSRMERAYLGKFKLDNKRKNSFFSFHDDLRNLSKYCKTWIRSQPDWIKLNFDGYCGGELYGFGGFFSNDEGKVLLSYAGPMGNTDADFDNGKDQIAAQVEGMREGVRCFKQLMSDYCQINANLIIESSALSVIRWANKLLPPPHKFLEIFEEMCVMLKENNCVVQYVYEEANIRATELAKLGMSLPQFSSW